MVNHISAPAVAAIRSDHVSGEGDVGEKGPVEVTNYFGGIRGGGGAPLVRCWDLNLHQILNIENPIVVIVFVLDVDVRYQANKRP